ncbi:MAG: general secretion pathway protein GspK [Planctomycetota bacterium]|nr:MAG: general secretion pathway protein GspK [Planctomycetota bacterium]
MMVSNNCHIMKPCSTTTRRGMLIVVVLVIIAMLSLLGVSFSFRMNADLASVNAIRETQQARLAAESGIARATLLLREQRTDMDMWYNNPEAFRRILVWAPDKKGGSTNLADQEEVEGQPAWRFSIVSYQVQESTTEEVKMRYGLTDEASKININTASRWQLLKLFNQEQFRREDVTAKELADALIDWRDADDKLNSTDGAESSYYLGLEPSYSAKNRPFETVEELLMVKGFDGQLLYGEDFNRNGYMEVNEDDGTEGTFPIDDANGSLDRGLLSYLTVYSWDQNRANDNKQRIDINKFKFSELQSGCEECPESIKYLVDELRPDIVDFIVEAQKRGYKFRSVGELLGLEVYEDGSANYDKAWENFETQLAAAEKPDQEVEEEEDEEEEEEKEEKEELELDEEKDEQERDESGDKDVDDQDERETDIEDGDDRDGEEGEMEEEEEEDRPGGGGLRGKSGRRGKDIVKDDDKKPSTGDEGEEKKEKGDSIPSPVTAQDMSILLDRLTAVSSPTLQGLINVNTAPKMVLLTVPGLSESQVDTIVSQRQQIDGEEKMTTAWLVTAGILESETFALVSNMLTARSIQFNIDAIGFADHIGTTCRIRAVVEMQGHLSRIKYYCEVTSLGIGYPVRDDERSEGLAYTDW